MPLDPSQARQMAKKLVAQALDESTTLEERRTFAMKAAQLIGKHDLLAEPFDVVGAVASPEVGEAMGSIFDLVGRVQKSGLVDSFKRAVGSSRRAAASVREKREGSRRRHRR